MKLARMNNPYLWIKYIWQAHIGNPWWEDRTTRRLRRQKAWTDYRACYLRKYIPFIENLKCNSSPLDNPDENLFSIWFQGEENAHEIVKKCLQNIRKRFGSRFILLDKESLFKYVALPDYIIAKWNDGTMMPAHFSDICRLDLLARYGGYWFDATDFITSTIPDFIENADFFVYVTSEKFLTSMFIQNCFIRAKKNDPLITMWRDLLLHYWKNESRPVHYYITQMLFEMLVTHNPLAKTLFERMPKMEMDPTHVLWHEIGNLPFEQKRYESMCKEAFFQKLSYKPQIKGRGVNDIIPGSFADYVLNKI